MKLSLLAPTQVLRASGSKRGHASTFRRTWRTPGLTSHQMLDAGVAARQHAARKDLKKSRRPFANYFRTAFPLASRSPSASVDPRSGRMSAYARARLMTDPRATWGAPWEVGARRGGDGAGRRRRDVRGAASGGPDFGADDLDAVIERLVDLRFRWDKEDGVVATGLVPESLYGGCAHCAAFAPEEEQRRREERLQQTETVMVGGTPVPLRVSRRRSGHPKTDSGPRRWGFTGVDAVPAVVLDATRGPLVSAVGEPEVTLRWKAPNRRAESVEAVLAARRAVSPASVVGLSPRSAVLLLKCAATAEMADPALDVALAVAAGEAYRGLGAVECLEVLRSLRRVAVARALGTAATTTAAALYSPAHPMATADAFRQYVDDAAPFLAERVWSQLPEQCRALAAAGHVLDWLDLLGLAVELAGAEQLPAHLPNPVTEEAYASKFFFLRYTLELEAALLEKLPSGAGGAAGARDAQSEFGGSGGERQYVDSDGELMDRPLIEWSCVALLVRLVAEALGDVLVFVSRSLQQHAELAAEEEEHQLFLAYQRQQQQQQGARGTGGGDGPSFAKYLEELAQPHARPPLPPTNATIAERRWSRRRGGRGMRLRLLPFEDFPTICRCLPHSVAADAARRALRKEQERQFREFREGRRQHRQRTSPAGGRDDLVKAEGDDGDGSGRQVMQSPFASILERYPAAVKHLERAAAALEWATAILRACHTRVSALPPRIAPEVTAAPSDTAAAAGGGGGGVATAAATGVEKSPEEEGVGTESNATATSTTSTTASTETGAAGGAADRANTFRPFENAVAIQRRRVACDRLARAKIQHQLDTLFATIPWGDVETRLIEPPPPPPPAAPEPEPAPEATAPAEGEEGKKEEEEVPGEDTFDLNAAMLADLAPPPPPPPAAEPERAPAVDATAGDDGNQRDGAAAAELSEAEDASRQLLKTLSARAEEFEAAVADLLDAHEAYFGLDPSAAELLGSEDDNVQDVADATTGNAAAAAAAASAACATRD